MKSSNAAKESSRVPNANFDTIQDELKDFQPEDRSINVTRCFLKATGEGVSSLFYGSHLERFSLSDGQSHCIAQIQGKPLALCLIPFYE